MSELNLESFPEHSAAIILAGGTGARMGGEKQYIEILSMPMIEWTVSAFQETGRFDEIIIVLSSENIKKHGDSWNSRGIKTALAGDTRMASLRNGFGVLSNAVKYVAVHDGARPLVNAEIIYKCMAEASRSGASVPAVPLKDTVKKVSDDGKTVLETVERGDFRIIQTPQCYKRELLEKILRTAEAGRDYTDESQVLEKLKIGVKTVESDSRNIKVTTPDDIIIAEAFMKNKSQVASLKSQVSSLKSQVSSLKSQVSSLKSEMPKIRFGFGYDIHRMVEGRPLMMGGIRIPHNKGLLGHSDGDVVLHAICDAILGSVAEGEIGMYFPPTDLTIMGISSAIIAEKVLDILKRRNAKLSQVDATIVAEEPKIKPYYEEMRKTVAKIFGLSLSDVSIKAKSREGLGEIGHGEAVACYAVVSVCAYEG
ncbi:MAG: 2-C-methyl-D-erythritol 4-phosphate cytidylyltransferase [Elusimicrobia bacterium]|nr:2-C-methyl-D-erythritol 4-phosphate cytidylyltransferase [Elusimicrobiota bacterium]